MNFDTFQVKPIKERDLHSYFDLINRNRDRLSKYFPVTMRETIDIEQTRAHIASRIIRAQRKEYYTFLALDSQNERSIASIFIKDIDWSIPKCELGFYIDKDYEGKGISTKLVAMLVAHCFDELGMNKVFMRIAETNYASRRVAEKNEFVAEGILRKDFKTAEGELIDVMYYGRISSRVKM